jgi:hypothetical protein
MNKEEAYDALISPLMAEIIRQCQHHNIAMLATFAIPTDADDGLCCTSCLPDETGDLPRHIALAKRLITHGEGRSFAFTITKEAEA